MLRNPEWARAKDAVMTVAKSRVTKADPAPLPHCMESNDDAIATVQRELAQLASCLLPQVPTAPAKGVLALEQRRAVATMHEKLHVARRHVAFLEHRTPHDPIVHELRAEVELVTARLVEIGIVNRGAFVRKSSPQIGGSFGGCARLTA
jgi:hypothetical protein